MFDGGKKKQIDMTQGNPVKLLLYFALPILAGNVFQQFYNIMDSIIVGQFVGPNALAAVGICTSPYGVFVSFTSGMATGIGIVTSQFFGGGQSQKIRQVVINSCYLMLLVSLLSGGLGIVLAPWLLRLLGTPEAIYGQALIYMRLMFISTVGMAYYNCFSGILRALGDSKTPLYILIFSSILNIALNVLFVTVVRWGVFGVGLATVIGQAASAVVTYLTARKRYEYFQFGLSEMKRDTLLMGRLFRMGIPLALQGATISLSGTILQSFINGFGETVIAAHTVVVKFDNILNMPLHSLSMAQSTYTGQNAGAGRLDRIKKGYHAIWTISIFYATLIFLIGHTCAGIFVNMFVSDDAQVMSYGVRGIAIYSSAVLGLSMIYANRSVLNGAGDTTFALINGAVEIAGRLGFALLFIKLLKIGPEGIWYTTIANWTLTGIVCQIRYSSGVWKKKISL